MPRLFRPYLDGPKAIVEMERMFEDLAPQIEYASTRLPSSGGLRDGRCSVDRRGRTRNEKPSIASGSGALSVLTAPSVA